MRSFVLTAGLVGLMLSYIFPLVYPANDDGAYLIFGAAVMLCIIAVVWGAWPLGDREYIRKRKGKS